MVKPQVSIVVIGRNEEEAIEKCLNAATLAAEQIGGAEIIYVDSASTDDSAIVARECGARVFSLKPDWTLSPSAGRFIGAHYACGEYILFIDADTLVYKDFLPIALAHFQQNPQIGGINGRIDDLNDAGELMANVETRSDETFEVEWLRGPCCFYRRETLLAVGSFNPYLIAEEEAELGLRIVKNNWKLLVLPVPMACHTRNFDPRSLRNGLASFKREIASKRFGEDAKAFFYALREGCGLKFLWMRLKTTIIFSFWILICASSLLLPAIFYPKTVFVCLILFGIAAVYAKKRSFNKTVYFVCEKILSVVSFTTGLRKISAKTGADYPLDVVKIS